MDRPGWDTPWMAEHHFQCKGYEAIPNLLQFHWVSEAVMPAFRRLESLASKQHRPAGWKTAEGLRFGLMCWCRHPRNRSGDDRDGMAATGLSEQFDAAVIIIRAYRRMIGPCRGMIGPRHGKDFSGLGRTCLGCIRRTGFFPAQCRKELEQRRPH
jgi:hypothetical protein